MWFSCRRKLIHAVTCVRFTRLSAIINLFKLVVSFYLSRVTRKPLIMGTPWALSVEPSGLCNLHCPECPLGAKVLDREGGQMNLGIFEKVIRETGKGLIHLNLFFQGEPLLNPELGKMVAIASKNKIYTTINSNGHFLTASRCKELVKSGLTRLVISLDGLTTESYSTYRVGGDIDKVKEGVRNILAARAGNKSITPFVCIQFLVFRHNEHELGDLNVWCREAGVDKLEVKTAQFNEFSNGVVEPPVITRYSRYIKNDDGMLRVKGRAYNHCFRQWGGAVIAWQGSIAPCCFDKNVEHTPGNIGEKNFLSLWKSSEMQEFRRKILTARGSVAICRNCTGGRHWIY